MLSVEVKLDHGRNYSTAEVASFILNEADLPDELYVGDEADTRYTLGDWSQHHWDQTP